MTAEKPELRAEPIQPEEKKYEAPDLTPDKKKVRELAGGERLDKGSDESVLKYNKAWAEMYQEKGVDHPLVKKILEFQGEWDAKKAVDAIKEMQKDLGVEADGVIGEQTLRKYHERLEKNEREGIRSELPEGNNQSPFDTSVETFSTIDRLWAEEKQEKLKTHAEKLAQAETNTVAQDINGKTVQVTEENGEKVFMGTEENSNKYYNPESGEYETKEERQKRWEEKKEKEAATKEEEITKIEGVLNRGEDVSTLGTEYQYEMKWNTLSRTDDTNGTTETWNDSRKTWETQEKKEESDRNDLTEKTKEVVDDVDQEDLTISTDIKDLGGTALSLYKKYFPEDKIGEQKIGELGEYSNGSMTPEQKKEVEALNAKMQEFVKEHPKAAELTLEQFQQLQEKPESFATSDFVPKDGKPVDPEEYGIKSDYMYAQDSIGRRITIPKTGAGMDSVKIRESSDGTDKTQRQWLEWVVNNGNIELTKEYQVPGSPNLRFQKGLSWIEVYEAGKKDAPTMVYQRQLGQEKYEWQNIADTQAVSGTENISFVNPTMSESDNIAWENPTDGAVKLGQI